MELVEFLKIAGPLLAVGGAWGGARVALNGTRRTVQEVERNLRAHISEEHAADMHTHERIAKIETKLDILIDREK